MLLSEALHFAGVREMLVSASDGIRNVDKVNEENRPEHLDYLNRSMTKFRIIAAFMLAACERPGFIQLFRLRSRYTLLHKLTYFCFV